ncbi:dihydrolipoyl dehydrogenase [Nocardioides sp. L-11A]|uniref:dihydrolipoyl dehydrogenase n=1 Tax=Nocardioides sp. L-11A TaxID=3043848 RepID=UPI00249AF35C|nr:dihydrolipoyl dehydrogenase [Nocardioides sp. L-11A]
MTARTFDVVVIGAGPGGYVAAIRAAQLGRSVAVIEEKYWGGVCLNVGCIPSKALLRNAELAHTFRHHAATFGIGGEATFDYDVAHRRSRDVAEGRAKGVHFLMRKNGITEVGGRATFTGPHELEVATADGTVPISFGHAVIATGARPAVPPGIELSANVVTYEHLLLEPRLPRTIAVVGAGAIGMELGYVLAGYGVDVTIVEYADRPLPAEDADVSKEMLRAYRKLGVEILTSARVAAATDHGDEVTVALENAEGRTERTVDLVLVATGFRPNSSDLGLTAAGVDVDDRGAITIDDRMRTSQSHIHAIGDVTMRLQLAHVAEAMGVVAAETIAGAVTMELGDYRMMPRAVFCQPQVASFGLTEEQARAEHGEVKVAKFPFSANGKAHGLGDPTGFVKLIADADGLLLGGHLVGPDASELLPELTLAQRWDLGSFELARNVHVHPTLGEALQEAFHGLEGHMINL